MLLQVIGPFTTISVTGWLLSFTPSACNFLIYTFWGPYHIVARLIKCYVSTFLCWPVTCKTALLQWEISYHTSRKSCSRNSLQTSLIKLKCYLQIVGWYWFDQINFLLKIHYETYQVLSVCTIVIVSFSCQQYKEKVINRLDSTFSVSMIHHHYLCAKKNHYPSQAWNLPIFDIYNNNTEEKDIDYIKKAKVVLYNTLVRTNWFSPFC